MTDKELDELEARLRKHAVVVAQANPTIRVVSDVLEWQAADAIAELRKEKAELEAALKTASDAADFYDQVDAASTYERAAVGGDHIDYCIDACKRARKALKGKETP